MVAAPCLVRARLRLLRVWPESRECGTRSRCSADRRRVLWTLLFALAACSPRGASGPPGLLLISLDTTRSDHLSAYGYPRQTSPELEALARPGCPLRGRLRGQRLDRPLARDALHLAPPAPARRGEERAPAGRGARDAGRALRAHGFQTAAVVSSFVLDAKFGFAQGFDLYDDDFAPEEATVSVSEWEGHEVPGSFDRRGDHTTRRALHWLREGRDPARPFFLFVHYFDPHLSYAPPEPFATRFEAELPATASRLDRLIARYDGEIAFVDHAVGELLGGSRRSGWPTPHW